MQTIEIEIFDYETDDFKRVEFPARKVVCDDCDGESYVLHASMRGHAYSVEEFDEFDERERGEYFRRGGMFDVVCPTCKGKNVINVLDRDAVQGEYLCAMLKEYDKQEEDRYYEEQERESERRMGC